MGEGHYTNLLKLFTLIKGRVNSTPALKVRSMKKRIFIWLIGGLVLICGFLFYSFYEEAKRRAVEKLSEEQLIHAKQAAQGVEEFFHTWIGILTSLAGMEEIIENTIEGKRYMWLFFEAHQKQIKSVTRVDEKGTILYTVPYHSSIGSNISNQKHVREILGEHKPVVSDVFRAVQGFEAIAIHVPVFRGTSFKGTIAILIDFESLARRYFGMIRIGQTGYAWVISQNGKLIYSPILESVGKSILEIFEEFPSSITMAQEMLKGQQGRAVYMFDRLDSQKTRPAKNLAIYMPIRIGNTFWSIAVSSSEKEVLSSLASFRNRLILILLVLFTGGLLLSILGVKAYFIVAEEERRKRAEEELRKLNLELEQRVVERTAELASAMEKAQAADRLKSAFLATMSHELRTPLNSIIGFTGILLQGLAGPLNEEQQKQLGMVQSSARHLLSLINDVLDISKIEAGQLVLSITSFELKPSIEKVVKMISPMAEKKGLDLRVEMDDNLGTVSTDQRRLEQVIINLLTNAIKFTEKGHVTLSCRSEDNGYVISVSDTGIGIPPEEVENIFKPFHQIDTGLTRKYEGTGLGLSICKRMVEKMGGTIDVESQVGRGSIFTIQIPKHIGGLS